MKQLTGEMPSRTRVERGGRGREKRRESESQPGGRGWGTAMATRVEGVEGGFRLVGRFRARGGFYGPATGATPGRPLLTPLPSRGREFTGRRVALNGDVLSRCSRFFFLCYVVLKEPEFVAKPAMGRTVPTSNLPPVPGERQQRRRNGASEPTTTGLESAAGA
ncbi:uncharacterized protein CIMG_13071 [Coccidioides immitis RS]|uniref:Uncharacterized protein n=1 Tax=Coccidioides immitis (strain RS) TaxID=246410 RepID=A0A0D8JWF9_COCIM|nr:uncharacterized protein CIMG_13071 [Coccidioides immitis RS]KJF60608.1 hypothetical protein CIMG_13071 [Coccidioides immitis RS]